MWLVNGLLKSCPLCICGEILSSKHIFNDDHGICKSDCMLDVFGFGYASDFETGLAWTGMILG